MDFLTHKKQLPPEMSKCITHIIIVALIALFCFVGCQKIPEKKISKMEFTFETAYYLSDSAIQCLKPFATFFYYSNIDAFHFKVDSGRVKFNGFDCKIITNFEIKY